MKLKFLLLAVLFILQSCSFDTPSDYFNKSTLNTNKFVPIGAEHFENLIRAKENKHLIAITGPETWESQDNLELHLSSYLIPDIEKDLEDVKSLRPTDETKDMIEASINLYNYTLDRYRNEYFDIAKLIDGDASKIEIEMAIMEFERKYIDTFWDLHEKLTTIAIPYAETNGITVSRY